MNASSSSPSTSALNVITSKELSLLTVREVAEILRLSKSRVYVLLTRKELPHIRIGKRKLIRKTELERWLEANSQKAVF